MWDVSEKKKNRTEPNRVHPSLRGRLSYNGGRNRPFRDSFRGSARRRTPLGTGAGPGRTRGSVSPTGGSVGRTGGVPYFSYIIQLRESSMRSVSYSDHPS